MSLHLAGTYQRTVHASLDRVWENVHDWEHLAHLHDGSFARCELVDRGPWGWRAWLTNAGADAAQLIELRTDRAAGRYVSVTLEGTGAGSEIRVALSPREPHVTDVAVEFHLPEHRPERLRALGAAYADAYHRLWNEDEEMMRARERALTTPRADKGDEALALGPEEAVRAGLPLLFDLSGRRWRLVAIDGALLAHATTCPHWLGPLEDAAVIDGAVRCPWHGWRFDVASGCRLGAAGPALPPAPRIDLAHGRVVARGGALG